jgi:hypothetical protein
MACDLARRVGSWSPTTVRVVFLFCIVRPTRNAYPNAGSRGREAAGQERFRDSRAARVRARSERVDQRCRWAGWHECQQRSF